MRQIVPPKVRSADEELGLSSGFCFSGLRQSQKLQNPDQQKLEESVIPRIGSNRLAIFFSILVAWAIRKDKVEFL